MPVLLNSVVAHQWNCDHFGHLNARHYGAAFDDALFIFWSRAGVEFPRHGEAGTIPVTAQLTIKYMSEVVAGAVLHITGQPIRVGGKSVTLLLEMKEGADDRIVATCEAVEVFFDAIERRSAAIPASVRTKLEEGPPPHG